MQSLLTRAKKNIILRRIHANKLSIGLEKSRDRFFKSNNKTTNSGLETKTAVSRTTHVYLALSNDLTVRNLYTKLEMPTFTRFMRVIRAVIFKSIGGLITSFGGGLSSHG